MAMNGELNEHNEYSIEYELSRADKKTREELRPIADKIEAIREVFVDVLRITYFERQKPSFDQLGIDEYEHLRSSLYSVIKVIRRRYLDTFKEYWPLRKKFIAARNEYAEFYDYQKNNPCRYCKHDVCITLDENGNCPAQYGYVDPYRYEYDD